jgi:ribosomal protein L40E
VAPEVPRAPRIAPIHETILRFPPQAAPTTPDTTEQPIAAEDASPEVAARRAQLDLLGLGDPGQGPVAPERPAVIPYRSRGAAPTAIELAARGAFWDASAREVAAAAANIGVQSCGQCGLSLSANARFCRRCGTRQAQSA